MQTEEKGDHGVTLANPSYLMFAGPDNVKAVAIFAAGTGTKEIPLSGTTFVQVSGMLVAIDISGPDGKKSLQPETDRTSGPYAWAVLQFPATGTGSFDLRILVNGTEEVVLFSAGPAGKKPPTKSVIYTCVMEHGAVYNDLDAGVLSVYYVVPGSDIITTPTAPRGQYTGGVFSGDIIAFITDVNGKGDKWNPSQEVRNTKGLPVIVFGTIGLGPKLAIVRNFGPMDIFQLRPAQL